jgi:PDZ domain
MQCIVLVSGENTQMMWGERFRVAEPYFLGVGLPIAVAMVAIGVLVIHENARRQTDLKQIEQPVRRTDDRSNAAEILKSKIVILGQHLDDRVAALGKELETANQSIERDDNLIAALNARLNQKESDTPSLGQQSTAFTPPDQQPDRTPRVDQQPDADTRMDQQPDTNIQVDRQSSAIALIDEESGASKTETPDAKSTAPKVEEPLNPRVPRLGIGVTPVATRFAEAFGLAKKHGLLVAAVDSGSPAKRAGVRTHDLLLKIDDAAVSNQRQMRAALRSLKGAHSVVLTLRRDGKTRHVKLYLG